MSHEHTERVDHGGESGHDHEDGVGHDHEAGTGAGGPGGHGTSDGDHATATTDDPTVVGRWEPVEHRFEHLPIHVALLPTGKVLGFGGSGNDEYSLADPHPAELFDPEAGTVETVAQELDGDVFCAGHAHLPDGRLLVAGGTDKYDGTLPLPGRVNLPPFRGLDHTYVFDPETERWSREENCQRGRWYPTLVTLGDGSVLNVAGLTKRFPWVALRRIERWRPGEGWERVAGAGRWLPLYPRLHLLPDGTVFYAGSYNTHYTFPFSLRSFPTSVLDPVTGEWTNYGLPNEAEREEGASVLLPLRPGDDYRPRVLLAGGGTPTGDTATADAEVIDLGADAPAWRSVESMAHARYYCYPVLLPDGSVFVMGGRRGTKGHTHGDHHEFSPEDSGALPSIPEAIHEAERFDPETERWEPLDSMTVDRLYHSNALLLPDGRVLTAGSNPARRVNELRIETYRPPYLFDGPRPEVTAAPDAVSRGESFTVGSPDAGDVDEVVLVRLSSTTHCVNTDQRLVELPVEGTDGDSLDVRVPENRDLTPPGYYMLFALRDGVPSEAPFVRVE